MLDPINLRPQNADPERINRDVARAVQYAEGYLHLLLGASVKLAGKVILEIGPGINFGPALLLLCHGADKVIVTDLYLSRWDPTYHPFFYSRLKEWMADNRPELDLSPLESVIENKAYDPEVIVCYGSPLEDLCYIPSDSVDVTFSNAVLEHVFNLKTAFKELFRVSRVGALGFHQVDFRDHRDFSKPLEFLLLEDLEFEEMFHERYGECGNRFRSDEMARIFLQAGFEIINFEPNLVVEREYLSSFIQQLRDAVGSKYRGIDEKLLKVISGRFFIRKA